MRVTPLVGLAAVILIACGTTGLQGRIEGGRYYAPNGMVSFAPPNMRGPGHRVNDLFVRELDRGFLEEADEFGLQGIYYSSLQHAGISPPSSAEERRAALNRGLANFAMLIVFAAGSTQAEVVQQEFVVEQGKDMLFALVRVPGLSGAFDARTGKKFDAFPAILILVEGGYLVILRIQSNIVDVEKKDLKEKMVGYLAGLRKLRSELEVRP
jgi:hypothetical protein